jgi:hypothetical protein
MFLSYMPLFVRLDAMAPWEIHTEIFWRGFENTVALDISSCSYGGTAVQTRGRWGYIKTDGARVYVGVSSMNSEVSESV